MDSRLVSFVFLALCAGCGPAVESDEPVTTMGTSSGGDDAGASTGGAGTSTANDPGSSGAVEPSTSTSDAPMTSSAAGSSGDAGGESSSGEPFDPDCQVRCENLVDGSCLGQQGDCASLCEDAVGNQGEVVADAFEACVSTQPLCFSFLEDCMWAEVYGGESVEQVYTFEGSGFEAWEGRTVHAVLYEAELESSASIEDGQFSVEVTLTGPFDAFYNPRTFNYYVDGDGDGACTAADYVQTAWLDTLGTDFTAPVFTVETTPENPSNENLCGQL